MVPLIRFVVHMKTNTRAEYRLLCWMFILLCQWNSQRTVDASMIQIQLNMDLTVYAAWHWYCSLCLSPCVIRNNIFKCIRFTDNSSLNNIEAFLTHTHIHTCMNGPLCTNTTAPTQLKKTTESQQQQAAMWIEWIEREINWKKYCTHSVFHVIKHTAVVCI